MCIYHIEQHCKITHILHIILMVFYFLVDLYFVLFPVSSTDSVTYTEVRTFMKKQPTVSTAYKSITTS